MNPDKKNQWPYNRWWFPKNYIQGCFFVVVWTFCSGFLILFFAIFFVEPGSLVRAIWLPLFIAASIGLLVITVGNPYGIMSSPDVPFATGPLPVSPRPFSNLNIRAQLEAHIVTEITEHDYAIPPRELFDRILDVGEELYRAPHEPPQFLLGPRPVNDPNHAVLWDQRMADWKKADEYMFEAVAAALTDYVRRLPRFHPAPFQVSFATSSASGSLVFDLIQPFRNTHMRHLGLGKSIVDRFNANVGVASKGAKEPVYPHRFEGPPEQMGDIYLRGTPFHTLFNVLVPYNPFTDEMRFSHHWCLGHNGTGKTTFLRHLIKFDIERAIEGECSLVVIDSKKLIREMRTLKVLESVNTIIIDADEPFPLNPFHLPPTEAKAVLSYMLASLSDASDLQSGALGFYINATQAQPNPSLRVLQQLMALPKDAVPPNPKRIDPNTLHWFANTRKTLHAMTSGGIAQRLDNFLDEHKDGLARMFNADSFGLDIGALHKGGTVLLVDTNRNRFGKDGASMLGRLVIAFIDRLSSKRTELDEKSLKPVFVVMDEAHDYIKEDHIFADILEKARAQRIGVTVAHHHRGQIDKRIEQSLENAGIKSECHDVGKVQVRTRRTSFTLPVSKLEFDHEPQMEGYKKFRDEHKARYPYNANKAPRPPTDELTQKI